MRVEVAGMVRVSCARPSELAEPARHVLQAVERLRERCRRRGVFKAGVRRGNPPKIPAFFRGSTSHALHSITPARPDPGQGAGAMAVSQSSARVMRRPVATDSKAASAIASARAPSMPVGDGSALPSSTSTKWRHSARYAWE